MLELSKSFGPDKFEVLLLVELDEDASRLDQFAQLFLVSFSRQQIKKKIARGEIQIQGRSYPHKSSVKVYAGEKVQIITPRSDLEDEIWNGKPLALEFTPQIIFEDENLVAISKPAYMTTHPTGRHLFNCATVFFENIYGKTVHSIHRLDRETSGVLLLGKNPKTAQTMTALFENDLVKKCYFFIAKKQRSQLHFPILAQERMGQEDTFIPRLFVHCYPPNSQQGKVAETAFHEIYQNESFVLGLALPRTGRQHQIRAHAAFHGFPLLGDKLYSGDPKIFMRFKDGIATPADHTLMDLPRHALHATALKLAWPQKDTLKLFRAPIPLDFKEWISKNLKEIDLEELELKISAMIKDLF